MRRKRKLFYWVSDDGDLPRFWWCQGKWSKDTKGPASSSKTCVTFDQAMRVARKLKILGGKPVILQFSYKRKERRCREYIH